MNRIITWAYNEKIDQTFDREHAEVVIPIAGMNRAFRDVEIAPTRAKAPTPTPKTSRRRITIDNGKKEAVYYAP